MRAINDKIIEQLIGDPNFDVRNDGTVWNNRLERQVKFSPNTTGYLQMKYQGKLLVVARIMYQKFNGPLDPNKRIDHVDNNIENNRPENLRSVTHAENAQRKKLTQETVNEIRERFKDISPPYYRLDKIAMSDYGISESTLRDILVGRTW